VICTLWRYVYKIRQKLFVETFFEKFTGSQENTLQMYHRKIGDKYKEGTYPAYINRQ
jgi:hypothetical protein